MTMMDVMATSTYTNAVLMTELGTLFKFVRTEWVLCAIGTKAIKALNDMPYFWFPDKAIW